MKLEYLQVTVEPWTYPHTKALRIKVRRSPGQEYRLEEVFKDDDFMSTWDYIWARAGRQIKEELKEEK